MRAPRTPQTERVRAEEKTTWKAKGGKERSGRRVHPRPPRRATSVRAVQCNVRQAETAGSTARARTHTREHADACAGLARDRPMGFASPSLSRPVALRRHGQKVGFAFGFLGSEALTCGPAYACVPRMSSSTPAGDRVKCVAGEREIARASRNGATNSHPHHHPLSHHSFSSFVYLKTQITAVSVSLSLSASLLCLCSSVVHQEEHLQGIHVYMFIILCFPPFFRSITCIFHCSFFLTSSLVHANFCKVLGCKLIN